MRTAIIGAGAMGSMTGGLLREAGQDVCLVSVNREHIDKINRQGLVLEGIGGERAIPIQATTRARDVGIADLIVIFVKSYDTAAAAASAKEISSGDTTILTLQNGLGNIEVLEDLFGRERVLAGTSDAAATIVEPGRVRHTANGNIYIGEVGGGITARVDEIVTLFREAGFNAHATDNAAALVWTKLLLNLAINPLGTILRVKCEKLIDNEPTRVVMKQIVEEAMQVVRAKHIKPIYTDMVQAAYDLAEKNGQSYSSMVQDFLKKKRTEIDYISGAIVKEGAKVGVPTPVNSAITNIVRSLELTNNQNSGETS